MDLGDSPGLALIAGSDFAPAAQHSGLAGPDELVSTS